MLLPVQDGAGVTVVVRSDDLEAADILRDRLAPYLHDDETLHDGAANRPIRDISVRFGAIQNGVRDAHLITRNGCEARRTFSRDDAMDTALALLQTFRPVPPGATSLNARLLTRDGTAVVVADGFGPAIDTRHRVITAAGYTIHPYTPVWVDAARAEALVPSSQHDLVDEGFDRLPIAHLVADAPAEDLDQSASSRLARLAPLVAGRTQPTRGDDLRALVELTSTCDVVRIGHSDPKQVARVLVEL